MAITALLSSQNDLHRVPVMVSFAMRAIMIPVRGSNSMVPMDRCADHKVLNGGRGANRHANRCGPPSKASQSKRVLSSGNWGYPLYRVHQTHYAFYAS